MSKLRTTLTTGVASLGLVVGVATYAGASSGTINTTGPDSYNEVEHRVESNVKVRNDNRVGVHNNNDQYANSGEAEVRHNTTGGGASSGDAYNDNSFDASLRVDNSGAASAAMPTGTMSSSQSGSISNTGPDSHNVVTSTNTSNVEVTNDNNVCIDNNNHQSATTGDATVSGNTTGGSATTGDASNWNSTSLDLSIKN